MWHCRHLTLLLTHYTVQINTLQCCCFSSLLVWLKFPAKSIFIFNNSPIFIYSFYLLLLLSLEKAGLNFILLCIMTIKVTDSNRSGTALKIFTKYICTKGSKTPQKLKSNCRIMTVALTETHHFHDDADGLSGDSLALCLLCPQMM